MRSPNRRVCGSPLRVCLACTISRGYPGHSLVKNSDIQQEEEGAGHHWASVGTFCVVLSPDAGAGSVFHPGIIVPFLHGSASDPTRHSCTFLYGPAARCRCWISDSAGHGGLPATLRCCTCGESATTDTAPMQDILLLLSVEADSSGLHTGQAPQADKVSC